jgi:hypothetical protein
MTAWSVPTADDAPDSLLQDVVTAAELSHKEFPELVEFIAGIIVEGFGIVAGPPKLGKSWFTLVIALAVAAGGHAFGKLKCEPRPVLLLALQDSERRLQTRIKAVYGSDIPPHRLHILTRIGPGLLIATVSAWLLHHPNGLVVLDTLGRARQQRRPGVDAYLEDYKAGVELKNIVDAFPGSALLGVHHTRKAASGDFVDDLSGTLGLAGSADYVLVLRRPRQSNEATLQITGRDAPEGEYAFTVEDGKWILAGTSLAEASAAAQARRNERQLGDRTLDVLGIVDTRAASGEVTCAADVAAKIGLSQTQARVYLNRLAESDRIVKTSTGVYSSVTSVTSVTGMPGNDSSSSDSSLNNHLSEGVTDVTDVTPLFRYDDGTDP